MKTTLLLIGLTFCTLCVAHSQGLIVSYEETTKVVLPDVSQVENPRARAALESRLKDMNRDVTKAAHLQLNNGVSIYKTEAYKVEDLGRTSGTKTIVEGNVTGTFSSQFINMSPHTIYKNHHDKLRLSQVTVDEKEYIIEEPLAEYQWKIGKKQKMLSGYQCIEATTKTSGGTKITAWYTPDIPVSDGPSHYCGLPGLILYVEIGEGSRILSCTSIEQIDNFAEIEAPSQGEKISRMQYDTMVADWRAQMDQQQRNRNVDERGDNFVRQGRTTIVR